MERELILIGISGYARVDKDTVVRGIMSVDPSAARFALGDKLKAALERLNPIVTVRERRFFGLISKVRYLRLQDALQKYGGWENLKKICPEARTYQQDLGTGVGRDMWGKSFWVDQLWVEVEQHIRGHWVREEACFNDLHSRVVICVPDVRYGSEWTDLISRLTRTGGRYGANVHAALWRVVRPGTEPANTHCSEQIDSLDSSITSTLVNNSTVEDLQSWVVLHLEKVFSEIESRWVIK